jgi:type IV pilus assembly protein PilM
MAGRRPSVVLNVAAALRTAIDPYMNVCRLADLELRAVDLTGAALVRSVVRTQGDADQSLSTVVDIGASSTTVATREGGNLRSVRVVALGGNDVTRSLAGGLGIDAEIAEEQKRHMRVADRARTVDTSDLYTDNDPDGSPQTTAEDLLSRAVDRIIEEVARSVSFDAKSNGRQMTQGIQLVGGAARQPGLTEHVQAAIGVPTTRATAWADIHLNSRTAKLFATRDDAELIEELTCAIGLAMWKVPQ